MLKLLIFLLEISDRLGEFKKNVVGDGTNDAEYPGRPLGKMV